MWIEKKNRLKLYNPCDLLPVVRQYILCYLKYVFVYVHEDRMKANLLTVLYN